MADTIKSEIKAHRCPPQRAPSEQGWKDQSHQITTVVLD